MIPNDITSLIRLEFLFLPDPAQIPACNLTVNLRYWNNLPCNPHECPVRYCILTVLMLLMLSFSLSVSSQDWIFNELFTSGDFSSETFESILYSSEGFIYLGTTGGLFKTDGYGKSRIPLPDSIENESVTSIAEYSPDVLLVGTGSGHLIRIMLPGGNLEYLANAGAEIKEILVLPEKDIWMATYGNGLVRFDDSLGILQHTSGPIDDFCYCLETDCLGRIWLGTDRGINVLADDGSVIQTFGQRQGLPDILVMALYQDSHNRMWIGMESGGVCYVDISGNGTFILPKKTWKYGMVTAFLESQHHIIASTSKTGILHLSDRIETGQHGITAESISVDLDIISMTRDHHRNIIILTPDKILLSPGETLQLWTETDGFSFHDIHALHVDADARIWFSIYNSLYLFDPNSGGLPLKIFEASPTSSIISLYEDPHGNVWAGTFGEGLYIIDSQTLRRKHISPAEGLPDGNIISLTGDDSWLWLATLGGVANCLLPEDPLDDPLGFNQLDFRKESGLDVNFLYDIYMDSSDRLWFATDGSGIISYQDGQILTYLGEDEPGRKVILAIAEDPAGKLWFATSTDGLYRLDDTGFKKYGRAEGLRDLAITTMTLDHNGNLLILNGAGFDILNTESGRFSYLDPLFPNLQNEYFLNAVGLDPDGNIWLGSKKSLVRFSLFPDAANMVPVTILARVRVFYEDFDFKHKTSMEYRQNHLIFQYSAAWYLHPEAVSFQYQLEPHDPGWFTTSSREVSYSGLPPGKYTFKVRSALNDRFEQGLTVDYSFTINSPFYLQWWFLALSAMAATGLFTMALRLRVKNIKRREKEARERVILQFETLKNQVNPHFLFNSLNTLVSMIRQDREIATEYVENLAEYFRNILTFKNDDLIPLTEELRLLRTYYYLQQKRYGKNLVLNLDIDERDSGYLIPPLTLQILMENAIKHNEVSSKRPLKISVARSGQDLLVENNLQLKIHSETSTRTGLNNIKNRYRLASGMEVQEENDGSFFRIYLPLIEHRHESTFN
jgi:ligand-binding sensor domain-containing protein